MADTAAAGLQGENCNCTREEVAQLVGLLLNQDSDVVDLNTSSSTTNDVCQAAIPHGFISAPRPGSARLLLSIRKARVEPL